MFRIIQSLVALLFLSHPGFADCVGDNLIETLGPDDRAALDAALAVQPYAEGNLWRATRGEEVVHIVGTYHLSDPRHDATLARIRPLIEGAATVLVEAGPQEEAALKRAMAQDPSLMFITEGPSLLEQLPGDEWDRLATAMKARGVPPFMAAKFQPWYISVMLGVPPCAVDQMAKPHGLDRLVMEAAEARAIPVRALEPFDTIFKLFAQIPREDQLALIRATLGFEEQAAPEDTARTLTDLYFAEDSRRMWEYLRLATHRLPGYTPEQADAEFARMEDVLMIQRNRSWIPVIEVALQDGPVFAAFGALHLSGEFGVLNLLEEAGFTLERLPL